MALSFPEKDLKLPANSLTEINPEYDQVYQKNATNQDQYGGIKAANGTSSYIEDNSIRMRTYSCQYCQNYVEVLHGVTQQTYQGEITAVEPASSSYLNSHMAGACRYFIVTQVCNNNCFKQVSWLPLDSIYSGNLCIEQCVSNCYDTCDNGCFSSCADSCTTSCAASSCLTGCNTSCQNGCAVGCTTGCTICNSSCYGNCTTCAGCTTCASCTGST